MCGKAVRAADGQNKEMMTSSRMNNGIMGQPQGLTIETLQQVDMGMGMGMGR